MNVVVSDDMGIVPVYVTGDDFLYTIVVTNTAAWLTDTGTDCDYNLYL